ncbi:hypothetical protein HUG10_02745 [Halorarum halophilum]|uniref:KEOPS complex Pcc1-like subunit n=1 Tax=Halorarum halophilum TaxID=2743090 RepID=A0A7D5KL30_9EURY|nr:KEOPS complex subunit Pcc1 [Halobaculum halophilum]QLG26522.1 hypothetical protein HUG10_02745 [Halobaculum halophilum]
MSEDARTAAFETRHADAAAAATVAAALAPDNTPQMRTDADADVVHTRIERDTTGGLHATADDYLVNVSVADAVVTSARATGSDVEDDSGRSDTNDTSGTNDTSDTSDTNTHE